MLEEGLRYRGPVFVGVATVIAVAIALGAVMSTRESDDGGSLGTMVVLWLAFAGAGLLLQSVLLVLARTRRDHPRKARSFGKSRHPGRDLVVAVGAQPLLPALFGSMTAWDEGWALIPFAIAAYAHLAIAWFYVPEGLRELTGSA
jgi:hypothetical protein